jgi:hypothetical protein
MQKVQVFLREDQKSALRSIAARTGQKQSDLIRQGVDLLIDRTKQEVDWREAILSGAGVWADRTDLDDYSRNFREAAKRRLGSPHKGI